MEIDLAYSSPNRRGFLAGLMTASLIPRTTWADAGSPSYLSAAALPDGSYVLCGIGADLNVVFQIPLPDRGHAAAAHPTTPEAVAFARRPGTFSIVIDCTSGTSKATLMAPQGRHVYGHGTFSQDGNWLFTTENDYEAGQGQIGVWDVTAGYKRTAEFPSGGIGPHDIKRLPGTNTLVVANGGIDTHPDTGRTKLNIPMMRPNLTYIKDGKIIEVAELTPDLRKNSIRHIAVSKTGQVAFGMQWQGDTKTTGLVGTHRRGESPVILDIPQDRVRDMQGYIGSIAFGVDNTTIATTSPRGGMIHLFDEQSGKFFKSHKVTDASGVAPSETSFVITSGLGVIQNLDSPKKYHKVNPRFAWDNHLVSV
jgi:hypothetical protein